MSFFDAIAALFRKRPPIDNQNAAHHSDASGEHATRDNEAALRRLEDGIRRALRAYKAHQKKHGGDSDRNYKMTVAATIIGLLVFVATAYQAWLTRDAVNEAVRATDAAIDHFIKDQRPYVLISDNSPEAKIAVKEKVFGRIEFRNYGKSPAVNVRSRGKVFVGRDPKGTAYRFLSGLPPRLTDPPVSLLPPNVDNAKPHYSTVQSDEALTIEQHAIIPQRDFALIVVVRFEYEDLEGNAYQSDFCSGTLMTGRIADCPDFNAFRALPKRADDRAR